MDTQSCDFHKLFKILYFAEKEHLSKYGRTITGDRFIAMKDGPVPSNIYDIFKVIRGDSIFTTDIDFSKEFEVKFKHYIHMLNKDFDMEIFSESEIECLSDSINENKDLSFGILRDKSHDKAWGAASRDNDISIFDIAKAGGANEELLKYISITTENSRLQLNNIGFV